MKLERPSELYGCHVKPDLAIKDNAPSPDTGKKVDEDIKNAVVKAKAGSFVAAEERLDIEDTAPDGGWGWVVACACFATWFVVGLTAYNFGMLFSEFLLEMGTSTTVIAWIYGLGLVISSIVSLFMNPLVAAFGWRKVALVMGATYSFALVISAFATSALFLFFSSLVAGATVTGLYNLVCSIICHYFTRRRDFANTIMVLGSSINLLVIPHLLTYLHAQYGFRGAVLITGGISLNLIPAGMVFHPVEWHTKRTVHAAKTQKPVKDKSLRAGVDALKANILLMKSPRVIILALSYGIFFSGTTFVSSYIPFAIQSTGYTLKEAAHCITMIGVFHLVARFIHPFISGACGGNSFPIMIGSYFVIPLSVVVFSFVNILDVKVASMAVFGLGISFASAAFSVVIVDTLGLPLLLPVLCITSIFEAIGFLTIGPTTGVVRDMSRSYTLSLYVPAVCIFFCSFLSCICMPAAKAYDHRREQQMLQEEKQRQMNEEKQVKALCFKEKSYLLSDRQSSLYYRSQQLP